VTVDDVNRLYVKRITLLVSHPYISIVDTCNIK
jgi:hypothetical protein